METGAFVMLDALGFKGIWKRVKPESLVINKLKELRDQISKPIREPGLQNFLASDASSLSRISASFLSDTIIFEVLTKSLSAESNRLAVAIASLFASEVMVRAALTDPILAYRGCISFGEFVKEDDFIIGEAVDEAAMTMDSAQGAFVWLTPSANRIMKGVKYRPGQLREYRVPLKGGDFYETFAVMPFFETVSHDDREKICSRILSSFVTDSMDVQVKMQNTDAFLAEARATYDQDEDPEPQSRLGDADSA